jgi:transketolase C-terminal domain/subunit
MVNKNHQNFFIFQRIFEQILMQFGQSKKKIRKSANREGLNLNYPGCYSSDATVRDFSPAQNPKMVMMVPCDENSHIIYS